MKTPIKFIIFLIIVFTGKCFAQNSFDKSAVRKVVNQLFYQTLGHEEIRENGNVYRLEEPFFNMSSNTIFQLIHKLAYFSGNHSSLSFSRKALEGSNLCSFGYSYKNINWAKIYSFEDWQMADFSVDSPIKFLVIKFNDNNITRTGYVGHRGQNCNNMNAFSNYGTEQSVDYILFPYRNLEGNRERLIKAIKQLGKLENAEQAEKDPLGALKGDYDWYLD